LSPVDFEPDVNLMERAVRVSLAAANLFRDRIPNKKYMLVVDYTQPSYKKRLFVLDSKGNVIKKHHVAHGEGSSDPKDRSKATHFSNLPDSHMSSLGAMITLGTYTGKHGLSLRLNGLQDGLNNKVKDRCIVIHSASYVTDEYILKNKRAGQSWGCLAVDPAILNSLINLIKGGCFCYAYSEF